MSFCRTSLIALCIIFCSQSNAEIKIAYEDYPPYQTQDVNGNPSGIDIEIITLIMNDAGFNYHFVKMPWIRQTGIAMPSNEIDIILGAIKTKERELMAYFSDPVYFSGYNALYIRSGNENRFKSIKSLNDLVGQDLKIAVVRGTEYSSHYTELRKTEPFSSQLLKVSNEAQLIKMLLAGRVDAIIGGDITINNLLNLNPQQKPLIHHHMIVNTSNNQGYARYMLNKHSMSHEDVIKFNASIKRLKENGTIDAIVTKYNLSFKYSRQGITKL